MLTSSSNVKGGMKWEVNDEGIGVKYYGTIGLSSAASFISAF
jgi:hypothetical protein